jgi:4'-phosphopantetheinyl transferase
MQLHDDIAYRWLTFTEGRAAIWEAMLSEQERERLQGFGHAGRRREFVTGRVALRSLLSDHLDCSPKEVPLRVSESGALDVDAPHHHVSLAHSGRHAVAVVAPHPVGVDLEEIAPRRPDLDRFLLHPDERGLLEALPLDRSRSLILTWTLKEATLKGMRTGFRLSPKKIRLDIDLSRQRATAVVDERQTWNAHFAEREGCYWTVAAPARAAG